MSGVQIHNYDSGDEPGSSEKTWNTTELQQDFEVLGFCAPYVSVVRKSDGVHGIMQFKHSPRVYFGFVTGA